MIADLASILAQARALWRRDRALLWPMSGLFVFLPQWALLLLVPDRPEPAPGASVEQISRALEPWIAAWGGWYVGAALLMQYGVLAIVSLYMPPAPTVGQGMVRAMRRFPRALLASLLVAVPCGAVLANALAMPLLAGLVMPVVFYVLGRTALAGPVILAEPRTGAVAAVVRSWRLTAGRGLQVATLVGGIMLGAQLLGALVLALGEALGTAGAGLPATVGAVAAGVGWAAALGLALVQVVLYRRLAR